MPYADPARRRDYMREWVARRRAEWFSGKCCTRCGATEDLELDHVDASTKISHRVWHWSRERREAELAKCQPLCRPCHAAKSLEEMPFKYQHGTRTMYQHHGCRCDECRAWQSARMLRWRSKRASVAQ